MAQQSWRDRHLHCRGRIDWTRARCLAAVRDDGNNGGFPYPREPALRVLNSFGVICFGLVQLELAPVMGDEIENPRKTLPGAITLGRHSFRPASW